MNTDKRKELVPTPGHMPQTREVATMPRIRIIKPEEVDRRLDGAKTDMPKKDGAKAAK